MQEKKDGRNFISHELKLMRKEISFYSGLRPSPSVRAGKKKFPFSWTLAHEKWIRNEIQSCLVNNKTNFSTSKLTWKCKISNWWCLNSFHRPVYCASLLVQWLESAPTRPWSRVRIPDRAIFFPSLIVNKWKTLVTWNLSCMLMTS